MARFKVKAIARGTITGPSGTIYHTNPKGSDERAREPIVEEGDLPTLLEAKLIEDPGDKAKPFNETDVIDLTTGASMAIVDEVSARKIEDVVGVDLEAGPAPSGLETREINHYEAGQGVGSEESGLGADDADAAPAAPAPSGGRRRRS